MASRASKGPRSWMRLVRELPAARLKADGDGAWLPALVERLCAQEVAAPGPVRCIAAASVGLAADSQGNSGRRMFDGFDLKSLTVEELTIRYFLQAGDFTCGIHCEGAVLRDLFGILLFEELFDGSVDGLRRSQRPRWRKRCTPGLQPYMTHGFVGCAGTGTLVPKACSSRTIQLRRREAARA